MKEYDCLYKLCEITFFVFIFCIILVFLSNHTHLVINYKIKI